VQHRRDTIGRYLAQRKDTLAWASVPE
jgi:hypothetical protein